jgi:hypothetical protein
MYWAHSDNVGPAIHDGKLYVHRGNAIIAFGPDGLGGHNEEVQHESGIAPLYQTHALFQAKAQILRASRDELAKVLDTPLVPAGDLFYLQNLIATLEASATSSAGGEPVQTKTE